MTDEIDNSEPVSFPDDLAVFLQAVENLADLFHRKADIESCSLERDFVDTGNRGQGIGEEVEENKFFVRIHPCDIGIVPELRLDHSLFSHGIFDHSPEVRLPSEDACIERQKRRSGGEEESECKRRDKTGTGIGAD